MKETYKTIILSLKGKVLQRISSNIKIAIVDEEYIDDKSKSVLKKYDIVTVDKSWLEDCLKNNKIIIDDDEIEPYIVSLDGKKRKERDDSGMNEESSNNNLSNDINDLKPAKVQKIVENSESQEEEEVVLLNNNFNEQIDITTYEWEGVCYYQSESRLYPFILKFSHSEGNTKFGTVTWPTLGNAISKFKGEITNDSFTFTEYEIVQGEEFISPSTKYNVKVTGKSFEGNLDESEGYSGSIYALACSQNNHEDDIFG